MAVPVVSPGAWEADAILLREAELAGRNYRVGRSTGAIWPPAGLAKAARERAA